MRYERNVSSRWSCSGKAFVGCRCCREKRSQGSDGGIGILRRPWKRDSVAQHKQLIQHGSRGGNSTTCFDSLSKSNGFSYRENQTIRNLIVTTRESGKNKALGDRLMTLIKDQRSGRGLKNCDDVANGQMNTALRDSHVVEIPVLRCIHLQDGCDQLRRVLQDNNEPARVWTSPPENIAEEETMIPESTIHTQKRDDQVTESTKSGHVHVQGNKALSTRNESNEHVDRLLYDWFVVTSPEGASLLGDIYNEIQTRKVRGLQRNFSGKYDDNVLGDKIAVVGSATEKALSEVTHGTLKASFTPTKALGKALAAELPLLSRVDDFLAMDQRFRDKAMQRDKKNTSGERRKWRLFGRKEKSTKTNSSETRSSRVLYCASKRAGDAIERDLSVRGFVVDRINTYTVEAVEQLDLSSIEKSINHTTTLILTFASPSAVRSWIDLTSKPDTDGLSKIPSIFSSRTISCCIGETTAAYCCEMGFKSVYYSDCPGLDGWVKSILSAIDDTSKGNNLL